MDTFFTPTLQQAMTVIMILIAAFVVWRAIAEDRLRLKELEMKIAEANKSTSSIAMEISEIRRALEMKEKG